MNKCFIVSHVETEILNADSGNLSGSNISFYLGKVTSKFYLTELLNLRPNKLNKKTKISSNINKDFKVIGLGSGPSLLPMRFKSKILRRNVIKYILKNYEPGDKVIFYHSLSLLKYYKKIINKIGTDNCVLLIAEFYSDAPYYNYDKRTEISYVSIFKKYIFMSEGIKTQIQKKVPNLSYVYLFGHYNIPDTNNLNKLNSNLDGKIHLVYAGTPSKLKAGMDNAIDLCESMDGKCTLHLFTRLTEDLKSKLKQSPNTIYEGYVSHAVLMKRISDFDIGLATQNPDLPFNNSSFPSKIVTYLAQGLSVISSKSVSVMNSPLSKYVYFYDIGDVESISRAVNDAYTNQNRNANRKKIQDLNTEFINDLRKLLLK